MPRATLSPRENMLRCLRREDHAYIPWIPLIDEANTPCFAPQKLRESGDMLARGMWMHECLNADVLLHAGVVAARYRNVTRTTTVDGDTTTTIQEMCGGRLITRTTRMVTGLQVNHAIAEYPVKNVDDLLVFENIINDTELHGDTRYFIELYNGLGERGLVTANGPRSPLMELVIERCGIETFVYLLNDHKDIVERVMAKMHARNIEYFRIAAAADRRVEVIRTHEDEDAALISPEYFHDYATPCIKAYADIAHNAGKHLMVHACGKVNEFLSDIKDSGIDSHHYLSEAPVGDVAFSDAKKTFGNGIVIMAAIDPLLLATGDTAGVEQQVRHIHNSLHDSGQYVIMSAMKPDIPEDNIRMIPDMLRNVLKI